MAVWCGSGHNMTMSQVEQRIAQKQKTKQEISNRSQIKNPSNAAPYHGLSVNVGINLIHARHFSGVPAFNTAKSPRPPALDTAAANSGVPVPVIPPMTTGCSMFNILVILVARGMV